MSIIGNGRKIVTTSGTSERLAPSNQISNIIIQAETDNTGTIVVGSLGVIAALATRTGIALVAGDSITLNITDPFSIYIDATVNGDGVTYLWCKE